MARQTEEFVDKKGRGRPKGAPNKTTVALKTAIMNAFTKVGGEDYLVTVAKDDPKTFCTLLGRVLPTELKAEENAGSGTLVVTWQAPDDE